MNKIIEMKFDSVKYLTPAEQAMDYGWKLKDSGLSWKTDFYWYIDDRAQWDQKIYFTFRDENVASYYRLKWINELLK